VPGEVSPGELRAKVDELAILAQTVRRDRDRAEWQSQFFEGGLIAAGLTGWGLGPGLARYLPFAIIARVVARRLAR
jgi:hypothetical protein